MARKVGKKKVQEITSEETEPLKKLQYKMRVFRMEKDEVPGQKSIYFKMEDMISILDSITILGHPTLIAESLSRLREISGTAKGMFCAWYEAKDVKVLLDLVV